MAHTPAASAVIKKRDGSLTQPPMAQAQAQSYLLNLVLANRQANLKQALNDVFSGKGKATNAYRQDGQPVLHASSGNGQQSVTLFYYMTGSVATIFAMGEHTGATSYRVSDYGQPAGDFSQNARINL